MSVMQADTRNRIGMRTLGAYRATHRAPGETPPVAALFVTRPLAGVYDDSTQSHTYRLAMGAAAPAPVAVPAGPDGGLIPIRFGPMPIYRPPVIVGPPMTAQGPAPTSQQTTPTPTTSPAPAPSPAPGAPPTTLVPAGGTNSTAQPGTPVPIGWPTNQSYIDSQGNVWTYSATGQWQVTGNVTGAPIPSSGGAAGTTIPGTAVTVSTGSNAWQQITTWLQESSIIANVPNFYLVAGAGLLGLMIYSGGKRR